MPEVGRGGFRSRKMFPLKNPGFPARKNPAFMKPRVAPPQVMSAPSPANPASPFPLAVTVGFSGPRKWPADPSSQESFQLAARSWIAERLRNLPAELGLFQAHFLTGISQIAVGGDLAFTEACMDLAIPQRISLPQPSDVFLAASGTDGPDFSESDAARARKLLASPHIIQERVASGASTRDARFEETNIELVRQSDVIIAMLKSEGGKWTRDLIERASRWGTPVLVVQVSLKDGVPSFEGTWENVASPLASSFKAPALPAVLADVSFGDEASAAHSVPEKDRYFPRIKTHCSTEAGRLNLFFQRSAWIIISSHFYASACAVLSLVLLKDWFPKQAFYPTLAVILLIEIGFLWQGYGRHKALHHKEAAARWAMNRLLSEVARSAIAFGRYHIGFAHLWMLNLPKECLPLLRTMEILQLRETRLQTCADWKDCRKAYLETRLTGKNPDPAARKKEKNAQISYYHGEATKAEKTYHLAHTVFTIASLSAIAATTLKFALVVAICIHPHFHPDVFKSLLGFLGVLLPVVAVAALSLAAAKDLEARSHTFHEMHAFLVRQATLIQQANSEREFSNLLTETESRLLGETVTWFSRRTFTGIA